MPDLSSELGQHATRGMDLDLLERALFERLLLPNPSENLALKDSGATGSKKSRTRDQRETTPEDVYTSECVTYLSSAYHRIHRYFERSSSPENEDLQTMRSLIVRNLATAFRTPDLYEGQNLNEQFLNMLREPFKEVENSQLLGRLVQALKEDDEDDFHETFTWICSS